METRDVPPGTIVVGIDGSPASGRALAWAVEQAWLERRPLTLAHGTGPGALPWMAQPVVSPLMIRDAMLADGRELLEAAERTARGLVPDVELFVVLRLEDPRQVLIDLSAEAHLVVMGSRGRGLLRGMLLGSVSVSVCKDAACPVVVLRPEGPAAANEGILVGVDATERCLPAVEFAFRQASLRSQRLTVCHGFWDPVTAHAGVATVDFDDPSFAQRRLVIAEATAGMSAKFPDVDTTYVLATGLADKVMLHEASGKSLVVVAGRPANAALEFLFGEVSRALLDDGRCAVAIVPSSVSSVSSPVDRT